MRIVQLFVIVIVFSVSVFSQSTQSLRWKLWPVGQRISFSIRNLGMEVRGSFGDLQGVFEFTPEQVGRSSIRASVSVASVQTGISIRDNHLQEEDYFFASEHPRIFLYSDEIRAELKVYRFRGRIMIRGRTGIVDFPFDFEREGSRGRVKSTFQIKRSDFGVGSSGFLSPLSDLVTVMVDLSLELLD
jgi:polyisoprenoid-binding protein YceI